VTSHYAVVVDAGIISDHRFMWTVDIG